MESWRHHQLMTERINFLDSGKRFINDVLVEVTEAQNETGLPEEELERIKDWAGLEGSPSFLGSASMGAAFKFGDRVLKLTSDASEARAAALLVGKDHPNVYTVLAVGQRSKESRQKALKRMAYVVVYEFLDWPNNYMISAAEYIHDRIKVRKVKSFYKWQLDFLDEARQLMSHIAQNINDNPDILGEPTNKWHEIYPKLERISSALELTEHQQTLFKEFWLVTHGSIGEPMNTPAAATKALSDVASGPKSEHFHQLALALTFLSQSGVEFNDLKTSNIMEKNNQAAVIDVGYSSVTKRAEIPII